MRAARILQLACFCFAGSLTAFKLVAQSSAPVVYTFTTIASTKKPANAAGVADLAGFSSIGGIVFDEAGNLYFTDPQGGTLGKITPAGIVTTLARFTSPVAGLTRVSPQGVAIDSRGNLFVTDDAVNLVWTVSPGGATAVFAGNLTRNPDLPGIPSIFGPNPDPSNQGFANGAPGVARFYRPNGIVIDHAGNIYIGDSGNDLIRKISSSGAVTTLAGSNFIVGNGDGTGARAGFAAIGSLAIDATDTIFATDFGLSTLRKITLDGTVTTIAGTLNRTGSLDGAAASAQFYNPIGIAADALGNVFVADSSNNTIRELSATGVVTTIGGVASIAGNVDGTGNSARFYGPTAVAFDRTGVLYVADSNGTIRKGIPGQAALAITAQPVSVSGSAGSSVHFGVSAADPLPLTYQWQRSIDGGATWTALSNNGPFSGTTSSLLAVVVSSDLSNSQFRCVILDTANNSQTSAAAVLTVGADMPVSADSRFVNISTRAFVGTSDGVEIGGFIISGTQPKTVLIRASGPALAQFSVSGLLDDPVLTLFSGQTEVLKNDDWSSDAATAALIENASIGMHLFTLARGSKDAAILATLSPGAYTAQVSGKNGSTGVALIEVYEADAGSSDSRMTNISTRSRVEVGSGAQIAGFIIGGTQPKTVLIRAVGPQLFYFNVTNSLSDPILTLYSGQTQIALNDDWGSDPVAAAQIESTTASMHLFPLDKASRDSAILITLPPGGYTAQVNGKNGNNGVDLIEVYAVP